MSDTPSESWTAYVDALTFEDRDPFWWLHLPRTEDPDDWWLEAQSGDTHGPWPAYAYETREPSPTHATSRWATSKLVDPGDAYLAAPSERSPDWWDGCLAGMRVGLELARELAREETAATPSSASVLDNLPVRPTVTGRRTR